MVVLSDKSTLLYFLADFLSIITVAICFVLKVPQIVTLLKVKHAHGINLVGLLMELASYTIMFSYNYRSGYALLSYLEYPIILTQELILIVLVLSYKGYINIYGFIGSCVYFFIASCFLVGVIPKDFITFLVPLCTPIGASSKVIQLIEIFRTKNSDSISVLTWFISAFTNFTRIFTIMMDSMDTTLLLNFGVNASLSTSVMIAAYMYKTREKIE